MAHGRTNQPQRRFWSRGRAGVGKNVLALVALVVGLGLEPSAVQSESLLQRFDVVQAVLAESKYGHQLIVIPGGDQAFIDEPGVKIERQDVVVVWSVSKEA